MISKDTKMQILSLTYILSHIHLANAGYQQIAKDYYQKLQVNTSKDGYPNYSFKQFQDGFANVLDKLNGYGCWCYLQEDFVFGKGIP